MKLPAWGAAIRKLPTPSDFVVTAIEPSAFSRSTSALGTMAPVGSATTPCTVDAGASFAAELDESAAKMKAGDNSKTAKAVKRNMKISSSTQHRGLGNKP